MSNGEGAAEPDQGRPGRVRWAMTCLALGATNCLAACVWVFVTEVHPELRDSLLHRIAVAALLVLGWPAAIASMLAMLHEIADPASLVQEIRLILFPILAQWTVIWLLGWYVPALWRKDVRRVVLALWLLCGAWLCMMAWAR